MRLFRFPQLLHLWLWESLLQSPHVGGDQGREAGPGSPCGSGRPLPGHGGPDRVLLPDGWLHEAGPQWNWYILVYLHIHVLSIFSSIP